MEAFLPLERYIKRAEYNYGVGVICSSSEERVKSETKRKRNVQSFNQWLAIDIPSIDNFLDVARPMHMQSQTILSGIQSKDFILTLFITEARKIFCQSTSKDELDRIYENFIYEKFQILRDMKSGLEFVQYVNGRCKTHDMAKTSALLYQADIKGSFINASDEDSYLIFDAHKDIVVIEPRSSRIEK